MKKINTYNILKTFYTFIVTLLLFNNTAKAQYSEALIKAVYIERITRFIEWPPKTGIDQKDDFIVGVYNEDDFYDILSEVYKKQSINNKKVIVIRIDDPGQLKLCNICYLSEKAKPFLKKFISEASDDAVLLISGTPDFCKEGVHINFYVEDKKLKFEINEKSIDSAGFKVSYLLLQNTRIIN